ncbi:hypothetical protein GE253_23120 [Niveispirillum sp. SYP-B3756]|uniref:hypothetical protein n=1 Tax=Niveispirillum sp. SYP-B3756 TaxID=2662178 RepID=UPI0012917B59|nr:hypothetical protein [Niveispirillum sp. SYP-B3756]MQP68214.1 hypothetical protein [Niveispirillum sp. SYP-B3756]
MMADDIVAPATEWQKRIGRIFLSSKERRDLFEELADLIATGNNFSEACEIVAKSMLRENTVIDPRFWAVKDWGWSAKNSGAGIVQSMQRWLPHSEIVALQGGESGGGVVSAFRAAASLIAERQVISDSMSPLLLGPALSMLVILGSIYQMGEEEVPQLLRTAESLGVTPTGVGATFATTSVFVAQHPILLAVFGITILLLVRFSIPRMTGTLRRLVERLPMALVLPIPYRLHMITSGAMFLRALMAIKKNGGNDLGSLQLLRQHSSPYMQEIIDTLAYYVSGGKSLGLALSESGMNWPDRRLVRRLEVLADTSKAVDRMEAVIEQWVGATITGLPKMVDLWNSGLTILVYVALGAMFAGFMDLSGQIDKAAKW